MPAKRRPEPDEFVAARVAKLRAAMKKKHLPALLVSNFADVSYLTGFEGDDSFLVVTADRAMLVSDSRYEEQISREAPWVETLIRRKAMMPELAKVLKKMGVRLLGVQDESMTLAQRAALQKAAGRRLKIKTAHEMVVELRHIKDAREIQQIEQAIAMAEAGFTAMKAALRKMGEVSENEIASLLVHEMRKRGAAGASFDTIVAAGANGSLPHYRPGPAALPNNTSLLVDWGARAGGYCSDLTRVLFFGRVPDEIRKIYAIVLKAQLAAIAAIRPGKTGRQIDKIARDIITKAGYGKQFGHGLGHGFGRDIHENIGLSRFSKTKLKPGMVITVEPGIYLPAIGGVRIEDDVLVTETGCRVLSNLAKDIGSARV